MWRRDPGPGLGAARTRPGSLGFAAQAIWSAGAPRASSFAPGASGHERGRRLFRLRAALLSGDKARPPLGPRLCLYCWVRSPPSPLPTPAPPPHSPPPPFCYSSPRDTVTHEVGHPGVLHALCENGKLDRKQPFQGRHAGDQERMSKTKSMSDLCLLSGNLCQARRADRQVRLFGKYPQ